MCWQKNICRLFSSCKESEKDKIARLVEEWEGKEILFPAHSFFTIQGKDTVDFSLADADYKVVTYIDSVGCTSCKLQLIRWKLFACGGCKLFSLRSSTVYGIYRVRSINLHENDHDYSISFMRYISIVGRGTHGGKLHHL